MSDLNPVPHASHPRDAPSAAPPGLRPGWPPRPPLLSSWPQPWAPSLAKVFLVATVPEFKHFFWRRAPGLVPDQTSESQGSLELEVWGKPCEGLLTVATQGSDFRTSTSSQACSLTIPTAESERNRKECPLHPELPDGTNTRGGDRGCTRQGHTHTDKHYQKSCL